MTDKEIEKALYICAEEYCTECPYFRVNCRQKNIDVLDYINRLKAEIERLKRSDQSKEDCTINQHVEIHRLRDEVKQIRKNTAKNFAETLIALLWEENKGETITIKDLHNVIKDVANAQYGAEVDE